MRTKRGGFRPTKNKPGAPRVKLAGDLSGGGDFSVAAVKTRMRARQEAPDAGLKRYIRFPINAR
jgi:hypothetical protein